MIEHLQLVIAKMKRQMFGPRSERSQRLIDQLELQLAPAAVFFYSPDRGGEHLERHLADYAGILQADAYAGFNTAYKQDRKPGPITEAAWWAHVLPC